MTERQPHIDFRAMNTVAPDSLDFTIQPDDSLVAYIADRLPNAKARKDLQSQLDDNEHQILRWVEAMS